MLSKLFRFELKAVGRIMLPLYGGAFLSALILGLMSYFNERAAGMDLPVATIAIIYSLILTAIVIMTGVLSVTRFYNNLLGTEGYLMFSLPTGTPALIAAKVLSSIFWSFMSILAGMLSALVFALTYALPHMDSESFRRLRELFSAILENLRLEHIQGIGVALLGLLALICGFAGLLVRIYASLAVGHQWTNHRILGSVLAFLAFEIAENWARIFLARAGIQSYSLFLLEKIDGSTIGGAATVLAVSILVSLIMVLIYGIITDLLLDRRLNLE